MRRAGRLVEVAAELQEKYGMPIVNKRISVTPIADVVGSDDPNAYVEVAHALDAAADEIGIDFVGGFCALVQKGFTRGDAALIEAIPEALGSTQRVCSSVNVASTRAGINMDAVLRMADVLLAVSKRTAERDCIGCAKIVVFSNMPEDNPFMAGAMHGSGEAESQHQRRPSPARASCAASSRANPDASFIELADLIKRTAFKITRVGELSPARPRRCWAPSSASSTSRWRRRRPWATPSPRSSRAWVWSRSARPARPPRWRCSTTPSRRAARWPRRPPAACPARSSR